MPTRLWLFVATAVASLLAAAGPAALAQQPVRPLPKVGSCPLGYFSSGSYCVLSSGGNTRGSIGEQLWAQGSLSRRLTNGSLSPRTAGLLALIEAPEALEGYLRRAQSQDDA